MSDEPNFAARWSDRKKAVQKEAEVEAELVIEEADEQVEEIPEKTEAELLEELGLKDPDEMVAGDDFSVFMSKAIPQQLKNRALRKLWLSNPVLANIDNLVDYGEDYTIDPNAVVEKIASAYKVGRGYKDKWAAEAKAEAEAAAKAAAELEANPESLIEEEPVEDEIEAATEEVVESDQMVKEIAPEAEVEVAVRQADAEPIILRRKRMQFTFE